MRFSLLAAGLVASVYVGLMQRDIAGKVRVAEQKMASLEKADARRKTVPRKESDASLQLEVRQANEILRQLALPWGRLFKAIESSNERDVALLAVQPDMHRQILQLSGEAKSFSALLSYINYLESSDALSRVFLSQHEIRSQDPERPVRFSLVAAWVQSDTRAAR